MAQKPQAQAAQADALPPAVRLMMMGEASAPIPDSAQLAASAISRAYWTMARDSAALMSVLGMTAVHFYFGHVGAQSAAQVSQVAAEAGVRFQLLLAAQNQRLLAQNDTVIALLRTIADRLRPPAPARR